MAWKQDFAVFLQETDIDEKDWDTITKAFGKEYLMEKLEDEKFKGQLNDQRRAMYLTRFSSNSRGVSILIDKPHSCLKSYSDGGDYAWVHVEISSQKYTFLSV